MCVSIYNAKVKQNTCIYFEESDLLPFSVIYLFKGKKLSEDFIMADSLVTAAKDAQDI